jgi:hypothetical protein
MMHGKQRRAPHARSGALIIGLLTTRDATMVSGAAVAA